MDRFVTRSRLKTGSQDSSASPASLVKEDKREDKGPPAKKQRVDLIKSEDRDDTLSLPSSNDDDNEALTIDERPKPEPSLTDKDLVSCEDDSISALHQTAFESSLPAIADDKQAIQEYELMRASQGSQSDNQKGEGETLARINSRSWIPGGSSIYVDAFNLALDTVLEDELHLFNNKEKHVFEQWRSLTYDAQYLSVAQENISQVANRF